MDASSETGRIDKLGRRTGPRRKYTVAEKRAMVNANLLFGWRRLCQQGVLREASAEESVALLPVKVTTPTLLPTERETIKAPATRRGGSIEIDFAGGARVRLHGRVDRATLARVMSTLARR
jgi:transposase-like protein